LDDDELELEAAVRQQLLEDLNNEDVADFWGKTLRSCEDTEEPSDTYRDLLCDSDSDEGSGDGEGDRDREGVESSDEDVAMTVPAYGRTAENIKAAAYRKPPKEFSAQQLCFDFMKDWKDTRGTELPETNVPNFPQEIVLKLKNYRANKIKLADFFASGFLAVAFVGDLSTCNK